MGHLIAEEGETHLDHREEDTCGTKNRPGWCDVRELLREIQTLDGDIQR